MYVNETPFDQLKSLDEFIAAMADRADELDVIRLELASLDGRAREALTPQQYFTFFEQYIEMRMSQFGEHP
jgi:hypothetical protein